MSDTTMTPEQIADAKRRATIYTRTYIECPTCGCEGAEGDEDGMFFDGQPLICGCPGLVSLDEEEGPWINTERG